MGLLSGITDAIGLTDSGAADKAMKKASGYTKKQLKRLADVELPDIEKQKILLENPELVGLLEAEQLGPSAMEEISLDPQLREQQLAALENLKEYADTGITDTDKYAMEQLLGDVAAQERASQAAIEDRMARQGMESSGAALMAKMQAKQGASNDARQKAMQLAAQGQQNRMAALNQLASQSGQMQQADFGRQSQVASAQDAIARANAANRQQVNAQNLAARQAIENQRAATANQQQMYNKGLLQQQFQNQMAKARAQNQASGNLANMYVQQGQAKAAADASTMGTLGSIGGALIGGAGAAGGFSKLFAEDGGVANKDSYMDGGIPRDKMGPDRQAEVNRLLGKPEDNELMMTDSYEDGGVPEYACGGTHNKPKYASGGIGEIVDSGMDSYAGDRVDAKINDGEMILNIPQQQRLMDVLRGEESLDNLGESDIIEGVPREYRDELHEKAEESSENKRAKGLKALLDALGEE